MGRINSPFLRGGTPWSSRTLVFSFVGYQTREVPIDGRTTVDVTLQPEAVAAEEVVVLRYATQQEREVTGAVSTVDRAEPNNRTSRFRQFLKATYRGLL